MAIRKYEIDDEQKLTEEQVNMVREAAKRPVVKDDDNPELTDEQLALFRRVHENRQADRRRQDVTLRLTQQSIQKAKALGKGNTQPLNTSGCVSCLEVLYSVYHTLSCGKSEL